MRRTERPTGRRPRWAAAAVALIGATLLALPAGALAQCPQTSVADLEDEVMCPVCGTPLALATEAPQAQRERRFILGLVEQCRSKEEIKTALVAEFGESVLALPEGGGFELAAYLVPGLALLLGAGALGVAFVRWRRSGRSRTLRDAAAAPTDPAAEAALEADLKRYDL